MLLKKISTFLLLSSLLLITNFSSAQEEETTDTETSTTDQEPYVQKKGFRFGLYIGSYFANQYTANMYDGYGFDIDGNRNNWDNSLMNQKINLELGGKGYSGQIDQIAIALNVDPQTWTFTPGDMPTNMRYSPTMMLGLHTIYSVDVANSILINLNLVNLTASGNFTIVTPQQSNSSQINDRIKTFEIRGREQRMMLQFGYQHIFGESSKINWLVEGGLHATLAKFDKNEIQINNLRVDLTSYFNNAAFASALLFRRPVGFGMGAFAGVGANLNLNPKMTIQLLYNPTYERIDMGVSPALKLQHAIGLRAYYNM